MSPDEYINPKKTLARREAAAEGETLKQEMAEKGHAGGKGFGKAWTPEDRKKHAEALARKLRER